MSKGQGGEELYDMLLETENKENVNELVTSFVEKVEAKFAEFEQKIKSDRE